MNDAISMSDALDAVYNMDVSDCANAEEAVGKIYQAIGNLPNLDVAPVVHARWIPIELYGGVHAIKCSACNNCDNPSKVPGRYCWQCGARMDGEADG